jgi:hypothetical protein
MEGRGFIDSILKDNQWYPSNVRVALLTWGRRWKSTNSEILFCGMPHCRQRAPIENVWSTSGIF